MTQTRSDLLAALRQLSLLRPDWRLGQTLANLATTAGRLDSGAVWELEDDVALAAAKVLVQQYGELEEDSNSASNDLAERATCPHGAAVTNDYGCDKCFEEARASVNYPIP